MGADHGGLDPGLVDDDGTISRDPALMATPTRSSARDVAPGLPEGRQRFLKLMPTRLKKIRIAAIPVVGPPLSRKPLAQFGQRQPRRCAAPSSSHARCA